MRIKIYIYIGRVTLVLIIITLFRNSKLKKKKILLAMSAPEHYLLEVDDTVKE
jgi:hypothetical protein